MLRIPLAIWFAVFSAILLPAHAVASAADVYRKANPSVVTVITDKAQGSGFFFEDGKLVATNFHVIEGASRISVRSADGLLFDISRVRFQDKKMDLAILEVPVRGKPLKVDYDPPDVGSRVYSIGSPQGFTNSISEGIVSSLRQEESTTLVQFTAPASPGSSGGPLLDEAGSVIGIVTWNWRRGQNLNFAVSATHLLDLLRNGNEPVRSALATEQSNSTPGPKVYVDYARIDGSAARPGMDLSFVNYGNCAVSGIELNIQFIDEPKKDALTVYRHIVKIPDVLNRRDKRKVWIPIDAVRGHGESDEVSARWYTRVKIEDYQAHCD